MADAAQSKKRGAVRQITKDDLSDVEEDGDPLEQGTFKKASAEVMATRRIVKVRKTHQQGNDIPNPFASIQLVAPTAPSATPAAGVKPEQSAVDEASTEQGKPNDKEAEVKDKLNGKEAEEKDKLNGTVAQEESAVENGDKESGGEKPLDEDSGEKVQGKQMSFQQVSSTTNAFGTFGSALSSSSFTFGVAASSTSSTPSSLTFGSSSTTFGGFGSAAGSAGGFSLFSSDAGSSSPGAASQPSHATVTLQEVPTETGEEQEKPEFTGDAILYEFVDKAWKERGKGELRLNVSQDGDKKPRLVMRSKGNLRLLLNANLFPDMMLKKMENKSVTFACINSAAGKEAPTLTTYAVKLRDPAGFIDKVEAHKGTKTDSAKADETSEEKAPVLAAEEAAAAGAGVGTAGMENKDAQQV